MRTHTNFSSKPLQESPFISPKTGTVRENDNLLKGRNGRGSMSLWEMHGQDPTALAQAVDSKHGHGAPISPRVGMARVPQGRRSLLASGRRLSEGETGA